MPIASRSGRLAGLVPLVAICLAGTLPARGAPQSGPAPKRIVSTTPSVTEILFALGLGDRVVGVTTFCHYPREARSLPKVGTYIQPNLEAIAALRPDLVIIQDNPIDLAGKLRRLRLEVLELEYQDVEGIFRSIRTIAKAAGAPARGVELAARLRGQLDAIRARANKLPRRPMMFVVGRTPGTLSGIIVVGKASYLRELMEIAGGRNAFEDAVARYPSVSLESILARNPDVIVDMGDMAETENVSDAQKQGVVRLWAKYPVLKAVRGGRVYPVAADVYVVPGPRMVDAALAFARMLHPEAGF